MVYDVKIEGTFSITKKIEASSSQQALKEAMRIAEVELPSSEGYYVDGFTTRSEG